MSRQLNRGYSAAFSRSSGSRFVLIAIWIALSRARCAVAKPPAPGSAGSWIVVTAPAFKDAIEPLRRRRLAEGFDVTVVTTTDVLTPGEIRLNAGVHAAHGPLVAGRILVGRGAVHRSGGLEESEPAASKPSDSQLDRFLLWSSIPPCKPGLRYAEGPDGPGRTRPFGVPQNRLAVMTGLHTSPREQGTGSRTLGFDATILMVSIPLRF
jgi:hypothetical protein